MVAGMLGTTRSAFSRRSRQAWLRFACCAMVRIVSMCCGIAPAIAQFIAVCSASILAEELRISSPFSSQSRENREAVWRHTRIHIHQLQTTTKSDKLSDIGSCGENALVILREATIIWYFHDKHLSMWIDSVRTCNTTGPMASSPYTGH